jgi:uncharacterized protein (TIGR02145 family)
MLVYNTKHVLFGKGLYIWNGASWMSLNNNPCPAIVEDPDGNEYFVGNFGAAGCWMTQNLRYSPIPCYGCARPDNYTEAPWAYGVTYGWEFVTGRVDQSEDEGDGETNQDHATPQGLCPIGWHVPSDKEWNELEKVIALSKEGEYSTGGPTIWNEEFRFSNVDRGTHGSKFINAEAGGTSLDSSEGGFDGYPVGAYRIKNQDDVWEDVTNCYFWTSSMAGPSESWARKMNPNGTTTRITKGTYDYCLQVRCKKD